MSERWTSLSNKDVKFVVRETSADKKMVVISIANGSHPNTHTAIYLTQYDLAMINKEWEAQEADKVKAAALSQVAVKEQPVKIQPVVPDSHLTTDPSDPALTHGSDTTPVPQAAKYLVLSEAERAKGFVRPYRDAYRHVGESPTYALRDLTPEEQTRYASSNYVKYEVYPESMSPLTGRFWTQDQLDRQKACGTITTMGRALSETYARDPSFYGSTYCVSCHMHRPVAEFTWYEMDGTEGPRVGS